MVGGGCCGLRLENSTTLRLRSGQAPDTKGHKGKTDHRETGRFREESWRRNRKGCDIGYALAVGSCEKANSEDACTIAALDAITAFAVPNPNRDLAALSVFSGPVTLRIGSAPQITQP